MRGESPAQSAPAKPPARAAAVRPWETLALLGSLMPQPALLAMAGLAGFEVRREGVLP
jgi:hypothetical protein